MIRRGGAAKGTPPSFFVKVFCPDEKTLAARTRLLFTFE